MNKFTAGFVAGLIATIVLSVLMILKAMMGLMPELDVIAMLSGMMNAPAAMGWVAHFLIIAHLYRCVSPTRAGRP